MTCFLLWQSAILLVYLQHMKFMMYFIQYYIRNLNNMYTLILD